MEYSSKIKKYRKVDDGTYFIQRYSVGTYWVKALIQFLGAVVLFPFKLVINVIFGKNKKQNK